MAPVDDALTSAWGAPAGGGRARMVPAQALFAAALAALVLVAPGAWPVAAALAVAVAGWIATVGRRTLRGLEARPAEAGETARLGNIVAGLSSDIGIAPPRALVFEGPPNAIVCRAGGPVVAVSARLLEDFGRLELEAVIAHCLARVAAGGLLPASLAAGFGRIGFPGLLVGLADDVRAAAITRYPPALAAAIERCEPATGWNAPLFFAADARSHDPAEARVAALADL